MADAVGLPSTSIVVPPTVKTGQPALTIDGKPGAVFIGGEFCPYCAAERWALIMAFSKFGTFSGLKETTSSPWDTDPSTATFSFYGATYRATTDLQHGRSTRATTPTALGTRTVSNPSPPGEPAVGQVRQPRGFPFLDIDNKYFVLTPEL